MFDIKDFLSLLMLRVTESKLRIRYGAHSLGRKIQSIQGGECGRVRFMLYRETMTARKLLQFFQRLIKEAGGQSLSNSG